MLEHVHTCHQPDAALCTGYAPIDAGTVSLNAYLVHVTSIFYTQDTKTVEHAYYTYVGLSRSALNIDSVNSRAIHTLHKQHEVDAQMRVAHVLRVDQPQEPICRMK